MRSPEIRAQRVLRDALFPGLRHEVSGVAVLTIPHVHGTLQELCAGLRGVRRAERVGVVKVVHLLGVHSPLVILEEVVTALLPQEIEHLPRAE